jgi:hypothetical protein
MIDVVDKMARSRMMAGIRGPKLSLRCALHHLGLRYRLSRCGAFRSSRYPAAKASRGNPGAWLLLASAGTLRILHHAHRQHAILEVEV